MITSLQNEKVKLARALQTQPKSRRKEGKIVLEGARILRDAVERGHEPEFVLHAESADITFLGRDANTLLVSDEVIRHVSDTEQPQGIVGIFAMPAPVLPVKPERILILDAIRDPGNLGTILRAAAASGVQAVILAPGCVDPYNPKVLRGGMGAHFRLTIMERPWDQIESYCRDIKLYLADSEGDIEYHKVNWSAAWALIIGSEAHGASEDAERIASKRVYIPMAADTESINAAMAAAVILFEARRQNLP